jgi:DNA primase
VRIVELPEGHDPDTYLKAEGAEAYAARLAEAPEAVEWLMRQGERSHDMAAPAGKAAFFEEVLPALVRTQNAIEREAWLSRVADRGGLDVGAARKDLRRALAGQQGASAVADDALRRSAIAAARPSAPLLQAEKLLLSLVANGAADVGAVVCSLDETEIASLRSAPVLKAVMAVARRGAAVSLQTVSAELEDEESRRLLSQAAVEGVPATASSAADCVRELRGRPLQARMAEIQRTLAGASGAVQEALLAEKTRLRRQLAEL